MIKVPDGTLRILVQGLERIRLVAPAGDDPYLVGEFEELPGRRPGLARGGGADAERPGPVRADHRADALPAGGAAARRGQRRRPERPLPPRGVDAPAEDRGAPGPARDGRRRGAAAQGRAHPRARARGDGARLEDPVAGRLGDRQGAARVLPPPAAQGDPGRARRGRRAAGGGQRAPRADRREGPAGRRRPGDPARARAPREAAVGSGRVRRHPHVPRLDPEPALERADRGQPRPGARASDPRRGSLRPREGEGADHRVPRGREAQGRRLRADPVLRRAAGRRARRPSASRSDARSAASSRGSPSAGSATRPRSAGTGAPTSARCPARSSAPSATPSPATPSS